MPSPKAKVSVVTTKHYEYGRALITEKTTIDSNCAKTVIYSVDSDTDGISLLKLLDLSALIIEISTTQEAK